MAGVAKRPRRGLIAYLIIAIVMALLFLRLPTSFLPPEDQGAVRLQVTLPAGATDARLQPIMRQIEQYFLKQPDVRSITSITGRSGDQSSARAYVMLKDWSLRPLPEQSSAAIARKATRDLAHIRDARIIATLPPIVRGLGSSSGFNFFYRMSTAWVTKRWCRPAATHCDCLASVPN